MHKPNCDLNYYPLSTSSICRCFGGGFLKFTNTTENYFKPLNMQEFKVGDKIILTKDCFPLKKGQEYFVQINHTNEEGKFIVGDDLHTRYCTCVESWQLISPVERTIEDVEVGNFVYDEDGDLVQIVEIFKNSFAYSWLDEILIETFARAKELGWKIKQPEPEKLKDMENEVDRQKWLEKGEKEGWLDDYIKDLEHKKFLRIVQC